MEITERQKALLEYVVQEYVRSGQPVSSHAAEQRCRLGVSPATIRNEMKELANKGYLEQPHISAGRVPTDKGYRFFVNELLEERQNRVRQREWHFQEIEKKLQGLTAISHAIAKELADTSSALATMYVEDDDLFWKEGWEILLQTPEFGEGKLTLRLGRFVRDFEGYIDEFQPTETLTVYIGRENPFSKVEDFSVILAECTLQERTKGRIALIGPKRMQYHRNIALLSSLLSQLEGNNI